MSGKLSRVGSVSNTEIILQVLVGSTRGTTGIGCRSTWLRPPPAFSDVLVPVCEVYIYIHIYIYIRVPSEYLVERVYICWVWKG